MQKLVYVLAFLAAAAAGYVFVTERPVSMELKEQQALLDGIHQTIAQTVIFPVRLDPFTLWTEVSKDSDNLFLIYHYQITQMDPDKLAGNKEKLKRAIFQTVCDDATVRNALNAGIKLRWRYETSDKQHIMDIEKTDGC